jgi:hypothetical protein
MPVRTAASIAAACAVATAAVAQDNSRKALTIDPPAKAAPLAGPEGRLAEAALPEAARRHDG